MNEWRFPGCVLIDFFTGVVHRGVNTRKSFSFCAFVFIHTHKHTKSRELVYTENICLLNAANSACKPETMSWTLKLWESKGGRLLISFIFTLWGQQCFVAQNTVKCIGNTEHFLQLLWWKNNKCSSYFLKLSTTQAELPSIHHLWTL